MGICKELWDENKQHRNEMPEKNRKNNNTGQARKLNLVGKYDGESNDNINRGGSDVMAWVCKSNKGRKIDKQII